MKNWSLNDFDKKWIENQFTDETINFAEWFGENLTQGGERKKLTTSQIRNIFGEIKRIQMRVSENTKKLSENNTDFLLIKPKMAYAAARAGKTDSEHGALKFKKILTEAHDAVKIGSENDLKRFQNFCDFIEAILAYHKAYGGK